MRALLSAYGSRGDAEPMVGLAVRLGARGAEVRVCAPPNFAGPQAGVGVPLVPIGRAPAGDQGDAAVGGGPAPARSRAGRRPARHRRRGGRGM